MKLPRRWPKSLVWSDGQEGSALEILLSDPIVREVTAVLKTATFPHQLKLMPPFGILRHRKITINAMASPQSKPALVT